MAYYLTAIRPLAKFWRIFQYSYWYFQGSLVIKPRFYQIIMNLPFYEYGCKSLKYAYSNQISQWIIL